MRRAAAFVRGDRVIVWRVLRPKRQIPRADPFQGI